VDIVDTWRKLGRRLNFQETNLIGFDDCEKKLCGKAYAILLAWRQTDQVPLTESYMMHCVIAI